MSGVSCAGHLLTYCRTHGILSDVSSKKKTGSPVISVRLADGLDKELEVEADRVGMTPSEIVQRLLRVAIDHPVLIDALVAGKALDVVRRIKREIEGQIREAGDGLAATGLFKWVEDWSVAGPGKPPMYRLVANTGEPGKGAAVATDSAGHAAGRP